MAQRVCPALGDLTWQVTHTTVLAALAHSPHPDTGSIRAKEDAAKEEALSMREL